MLHYKTVAIHGGRRELARREAPEASDSRANLVRLFAVRFPFPFSPQTQLTSDPARWYDYLMLLFSFEYVWS